KLVLIPKGKFRMGSSKEEQGEVVESVSEVSRKLIRDGVKGEGPRHEVEVGKPFYLGVYAVTQKQYQEVMGTNPSHPGPSSQLWPAASSGAVGWRLRPAGQQLEGGTEKTLDRRRGGVDKGGGEARGGQSWPNYRMQWTGPAGRPSAVCSRCIRPGN